MRLSGIFSVLATIVFVASMNTAALADDGASVFSKKCKTCHSTGTNKILGPGLAGVGQKRSAAWLKKWVLIHRAPGKRTMLRLRL